MKSLFDKPTCEEIISGLNKLSPQSQRQWGKMDVAQMLAHCKAAFMVPLSEKKLPRAFVGLLLGWVIKKKIVQRRAMETEPADLSSIYNKKPTQF